MKFTENADKMYFLRHYYDKENRDGYHGRPIPEVFFINCHEEESQDSLMRYKIASAIERTVKMQPSVIGLDIRFKGLHTKYGDEYLNQTILANRDRIVVVRSKTGGIENRSFFDTDSSSLKYGYTNIGDYYSVVSYEEPSFSEVVLTEAGLLNNDFKKKNSILCFASINPKPLDIDTFLSEEEQAFEFFIKNRIVIFGDADDEKDRISLPFLVNGRNWMPGVYYHLYCINSMKQGGVHYYENKWLSLVTCFLLTILYSMIALLLTRVIKRFDCKSRAYLLGLFIKPVILFWIWFKTPVVLMLFTRWFGFVPDLTLALLSVAGIGFLDNFFEELKNRIS